MPKFNKLTLDNGLRIITVPHADSLATTVLILVEAGSKYETKEINGISHFLEHMCFKGTEKRPTVFQIASELDTIGASYNAFTDQEYTGYYAKAQPKHFDKILDILSDIYLNQVFDSKEIDKERGVITEEINMYEDLPMRRIHDFFTTLLYGDQPAGWDIAGRKEVIQKLTRDDFIKYRGEHYLPQSTIVVAAGKINEDEAVQKIKDAFSLIRNGEKSKKEKTKEEQSKPEVFLQHKESDQTHIVLGVRAFDIFDKRKYAAEVLGDVLGGGMSSRLFQKIRDEMAAAYYVRAGVSFYTDHGFFAASAGIDHKKIEEVIKAILQEFKVLAEKPLSENDLQKAKDHLTGGLMLDLETSDSLASFYGGEEVLTGKLISPEELSENIQGVKAEEVQAVARDIFQDTKLNLAVIGPIKDKEKLETILRF